MKVGRKYLLTVLVAILAGVALNAQTFDDMYFDPDRDDNYAYSSNQANSVDDNYAYNDYDYE